MREAIEARAGDAEAVMQAWRGLPEIERASVIEFLKTLRTAPEHVKAAFVDENHRPTQWHDFPYRAP